MLNTQPYNQQQYNNNISYQGLVLEDISFNGFGLQNATYCISSTNHDNIANIDINDFSYPQDDGGFVVTRYYKDKTINMSGTITASTPDSLVQAIDNIKNKLSMVEGYLYVKFGSEYRKIKATVKDINISKSHYNINFVSFNIEFLCKEPFFSKLYVGTNSILGETTTNLQTDINYIGTGETYPSIYIVFNLAGGVTGLNISIGDKTISITSTFIVGSILHIDGVKKTVTINGIDVDYIGAIGKIVSGSNIIAVDFLGTISSLQYDCNIIYDIRYK